jgi:hypothetical protein
VETAIVPDGPAFVHLLLSLAQVEEITESAAQEAGLPNINPAFFYWVKHKYICLNQQTQWFAEPLIQ